MIVTAKEHFIKPNRMTGKAASYFLSMDAIVVADQVTRRCLEREPGRSGPERSLHRG